MHNDWFQQLFWMGRWFSCFLTMQDLFSPFSQYVRKFFSFSCYVRKYFTISHYVRECFSFCHCVSQQNSSMVQTSVHLESLNGEPSFLVAELTECQVMSPDPSTVLGLTHHWTSSSTFSAAPSQPTHWGRCADMCSIVKDHNLGLYSILWSIQKLPAPNSHIDWRNQWHSVTLTGNQINDTLVPSSATWTCIASSIWMMGSVNTLYRISRIVQWFIYQCT